MKWRTATIGLGLLLGAGGLQAGDPLGDFPVDPDPLAYQASPAAALDGDGNLLIVYEGGEHGLEGRRFGRNGELLADPTFLLPSLAGLVAPDASGFTLLSDDGLILRLDLTGAPVGDPVDLGRLFDLRQRPARPARLPARPHPAAPSPGPAAP